MAENQVVSTTTSKQFTINWSDIVKGFVVAAIGAGLTTLLQFLQTSPVKINWGVVATVAGTAGVSYLLKNLFTPSQTVVTPPPGAGDVTIHIPKPGETITSDVPVDPNKKQ